MLFNLRSKLVLLSASQVNHAGRFVDPALDYGKSKKCWKTASGGNPKVNKDWTKLKGNRGGGTGDGLHHINLKFLRYVYLQNLVPRC